MKRIIISIIIAIAVVCGSIFEIAFVSSKSDEYIGRIKKIDDLVRDDKTEAAIAECRRLESDWDKNVGSIDVMLIHDYADSVSRMAVSCDPGSDDCLGTLEQLHSRRRLWRKQFHEQL